MSTVLITGGHGGIGLRCSQDLAAHGHDVVLAGRSPEKMRSAADDLRSRYGVTVSVVALDVSSLGSVREAAAQLRAEIDNGQAPRLDALICNAGARMTKHSVSTDGIESTLATNYLGHYLLVNLLLDAMAPEGRVLFTVSGTHDPSSTDGRLIGAALEPDVRKLAAAATVARPPSLGRLYATSKLCMVLFAYELDRRLRRVGSSVESIAYDPGYTSGTGFLDELPGPVQRIAGSDRLDPVLRRLGVTMGSVDFSGMSLARLATDPEYAQCSGQYFQSDDGRLIATRSSKVSYDRDRARTLWDDSAALAQLTADEVPALLGG